MNFDTIQQLIRIVMYAGGSFLLGTGIADGQQFQALIGGVISVAGFAWWFWWERHRA